MVQAGATHIVSLNIGILFINNWKLFTKFVIGLLFRPLRQRNCFAGGGNRITVRLWGLGCGVGLNRDGMP